MPETWVPQTESYLRIFIINIVNLEKISERVLRLKNSANNSNVRRQIKYNHELISTHFSSCDGLGFLNLEYGLFGINLIARPDPRSDKLASQLALWDQV